MRARLLILVVLAILGLIILANTVLVVDPGHIAVIVNQFTGNVSIRYPGTNILVPGLQKPFIYNTRIQIYNMSSSYSEGETRGDEALDALTKDGQVVKMDISVRFHEYVQKITSGINTIITDGKSILSLGDLVKR